MIEFHDDKQDETKAPEPIGKGVFANGAARMKAVPLAYPLDFGGRAWTHVHLARLTAGEVAAFMSDAGAARLPLWRDEAGEPVPEGLLLALDDDDQFALEQAAIDFLPQRFRGALKSASDPANGAPTAP